MNRGHATIVAGWALIATAAALTLTQETPPLSWVLTSALLGLVGLRTLAQP